MNITMEFNYSSREDAFPVKPTEVEKQIIGGASENLIRLSHEKRKEGNALKALGMDELFFELEMYAESVAGGSSWLLHGSRPRLPMNRICRNCDAGHFPEIGKMLADPDIQQRIPCHFNYFLTCFSMLLLFEKIALRHGWKPECENE